MSKAPRKRASRPDWKTASRKLRAGIERELRDYPASQVAIFTRSVESYLDAAKTIADIRATDANEAQRLRDLQRVLGVTERFVADYARIRRRVLSRPFLYKVPDMFAADWSTPEPDDGQSFHRAYDQAFAAMNALLAEIDMALVTPWRRGRPAADDLGLLAQMAARWRELFDARPVSTLGGKFANVAALVLENLHGRLPSDVSRQVRAALKSI